MNEKMNKKMRTPFAAILLILIAVSNVVTIMGTYYRPNIIFILTLVIELALGGILFAKKYNNVLVIALGCRTLVTLLGGFYYTNLLMVMAYALLTVFALALCEQTLVKADLSKVLSSCNYLFVDCGALFNRIGRGIWQDLYFYYYCRCCGVSHRNCFA